MEIIKEHIDEKWKPLLNRFDRRRKKKFRVRENSYQTSHAVIAVAKLMWIEWIQ